MMGNENADPWTQKLLLLLLLVSLDSHTLLCFFFLRNLLRKNIVGMETERNWIVVLGWCLMDLDADRI